MLMKQNVNNDVTKDSSIVLCCIVLCCIVLHCGVLCCVVLCCGVLYCIILCCIVEFSPSFYLRFRYASVCTSVSIVLLMLLLSPRLLISPV